MTKLAEFIRSQRLGHNLTLGDLAKPLGYKNISKGARRLDRFEKTGQIDGALLNSVVIALGLDRAEVEALIREDQEDFEREWNNWADTPIRPYVVARLIPAIYMHVALPDDKLSPSDAEAFAIWYAREKRRKVCVVLSRRVSIWVNSDGTVEKRIEATPGEMITPYVTVRGSKERFLFDFESDVLVRKA